jgi:hypothetical protein
MSIANLFRMLVLLLAFVPLKTGTAPQSNQSKAANESARNCPVTLPRKAPLPPNEAIQFFGAESAHWNGALYVGALWPDGTVVFKPGGAGTILPDGSLAMKFGWYRGAGLRGKLTVHGRRLDASAPPLRADIPAMGETGFQASGLIFPTEGCWEVTGEVANARVKFVTRVVKVVEVN